jgi:hypothetical protein
VVAVILFRGARLRNDYVYFAPWNRPSTKGSGGGFGSLFTKGSGNGCSPGGCSDVGDIGEGCVAAVIAIVFVAVAFVGAWLFVELLAPFIFFLMYWLFMKAIARAARDNRGCQGSLGKAMGWGALWATIYVAPIALATWALHAVHFGGARH